MLDIFSPQFKSNQNLTGTNTAQIAILNDSSSQVRVVNNGSNVVYVCTYNVAGTALVADATDLPVFGGQATTFTKSLSDNRISYYSPAGTTLSVMTGRGI